MHIYRFLVYLHSLWFSQKSLSRIFSSHQNYEEFYATMDNTILKSLGFKDEKIQTILITRNALDTDKLDRLIESLDIDIITIQDSRYPKLLREVPIAPYFLYLRWNLPHNSNLISVVGSRKSTVYSRTSLLDILPELVRNSYWIISGGAYGVDSLAHKITLENAGYTLAVFGTGIDRCYPKENKELFLQILSSGWALISAFPFGMWPEPYNFPIRNEIVAGLSRGTLVTEAAEKSGTLITAGLALDFGRDVFALPGEISKATSAGTNILIRDGQAKLVMGAIDILSEYETMTVVKEKIAICHSPKFDDSIEREIYDSLQNEALGISSIEDQLGIDISIIAYKLSMLEVRGIVRMNIDGSYSIKG